MMSFLKNLFGGSAPKPTQLTTTEGLQQLEEKADMLTKRIAHIQTQIVEQETIARQNATTNKNRAIAALKKKRQLEDNLKKAEGTLDNIESQVVLLENAKTNAAVLKTMADTAKIVKQQHDNLDINKVEDIVDEMREQREVSEEIANALSQTTDTTHNMADLEQELAAMQQEHIDRQLLDTDKPLPDVPIQLPPQPAATTSKKKDEEELDELKKWASAAQ